jgi:CPA2 family monovalent cation:H+ antiporter-2
VLIEDSEKRVAAAHAAGIEVVVGNAATTHSLALANIDAATTLIVAIPNAFEAGQAVEQSRKHNPGLLIVARAHSDEEVGYLRDLGANEVIMGEREIGLGMLGWTNGENAHQVQVERTEANLEAVAAALQVDRPATRSEPKPLVAAEPAVPVEELEAAVEAAHPEHVPEGPAEPLALVPAYGETPLEEDDRDPPALVVAGAMAAHEPMIAAPVTFAEPRLEGDDIQEDVSDDEELPPIAPRPPVTIEAEAREVAPEPIPASPRGPRAGGPSSAPGVPFKPEPEPAD